MTERFVDARFGDDGTGNGLTDTTAYKTLTKVNTDMVNGDVCNMLPGTYERADGVPSSGFDATTRIYRAVQDHTVFIKNTTSASPLINMSGNGSNISCEGIMFLDISSILLEYINTGSSTWLNCIFKDCTGKLLQKIGGSFNNGTYENCVFDGCGGGAEIWDFNYSVAGTVLAAGIRNCTFVNCDVGVSQMIRPEFQATVFGGFHSNIFVNNIAGRIWLSDSTTAANVIAEFGGIENNFYHLTTPSIAHSRFFVIDFVTLANVQATGNELASQNADPGVLDHVAGLYKLGQGAAAIGAGIGGSSAGAFEPGDGLSNLLNSVVWQNPTQTPINGGNATLDINNFWALDPISNSGSILEFDGVDLGSAFELDQFYISAVQNFPTSHVTKDFTGPPYRVLIEIRFAADVPSLGAASYQDVQVGTTQPGVGNNAYQLKVTLRNDG